MTAEKETDDIAAKLRELSLVLVGVLEGRDCPMCDRGKLRNPVKEHWDSCAFAQAVTLLGIPAQSADAIDALRRERDEARAALSQRAGRPVSADDGRGGPTVENPNRPCCKPDGSCCDYCCGN